jgi:Lipocalin-like domain
MVRLFRSRLSGTAKRLISNGPNPQGQLMYDANGRFPVIVTRSDLPKLASNNREAGTTEENKAIVQESLAYFGTYAVSEPDKTITS